MATNPYFTQYHTQRFSFIGSPQQRDGTYQKDQRFLNMYPELIKSPISDGKKYYLKKRPGISLNLQYPGGAGQGVFFWSNKYFVAQGGTVYANNAALIALTTSTGPVGFAEFRTDTEDVLFICDGTSAWTVSSSNVVTTIGAVPSPHVPNPIFLDGYIFLAAVGTQTINNSALNDPTTWPVDGFIDAEMYPDNIVGLAKQQNYLCAIGGSSVEFFYDNANATGSPLQRNAPAVSQFGCPAPLTISQTEKNLIMVGTTNNGGRTIWMIEGFQPTEIANEPVREALDLEATLINQASAFTIQVSGHKFYVLNLISNQRTFVWDFEEQMWHEWSTGVGVQTVFSWKFATDSPNGYPLLQAYTGGQTGFLSPTIYTDLGNPINCTITTSKIDFDTIKRKRFFRLSLIGDAPNGLTGEPFNVQWSDDDYTTWSLPASLSMNGTYPTINQLGISRRRAFLFQYIASFPLRLEAFELDIIQEVRR